MFKKLVGAIRQGKSCNCVTGGVDVARRHQGAGLRSYCSTLVDRVDLATPLSQSCRSVAGLSAPAPAKRAIAKRFRALAHSVGLRRSTAAVENGALRTLSGGPARCHDPKPDKGESKSRSAASP